MDKPYENQFTAWTDSRQSYPFTWLSRDCPVWLALLMIGIAVTIVVVVASHVG